MTFTTHVKPSHSTMGRNSDSNQDSKTDPQKTIVGNNSHEDKTYNTTNFKIIKDFERTHNRSNLLNI